MAKIHGFHNSAHGKTFYPKKGLECRIAIKQKGKNAIPIGVTGTIFWIGKDKYKPTETRVGFKNGQGETFWVDPKFIEYKGYGLSWGWEPRPEDIGTFVGLVNTGHIVPSTKPTMLEKFGVDVVPSGSIFYNGDNYPQVPQFFKDKRIGSARPMCADRMSDHYTDNYGLWTVDNKFVCEIPFSEMARITVNAIGEQA